MNDDAIKAYYSGVTLTRIAVWKCLNDPVVQVGWDARSVSGVLINGLTVLHSRYRKSDMVVPSSIIGGSPFYEAGKKVDPEKTLELTIQNLAVEGGFVGAPALIRTTPLVNYKVTLENVQYPDGLLPSVKHGGLGLGCSQVPAAADGLQMNLTIRNWSVGKKVVTMSNFQKNSFLPV